MPNDVDLKDFCDSQYAFDRQNPSHTTYEKHNPFVTQGHLSWRRFLAQV